MKKQKKPKNYKLRSKVYKGLGMGTIGVTTIGGFFNLPTYNRMGKF